MKHTKGKWIASHISEFEIDIIDEKHRKTLATVTDWNEQEANANLIASAPELIEALQSINELKVNLGFPNRQDQLVDWARKVGRIAREAIAKAEGGA